MRIHLGFILCVVSLLSIGCQAEAADAGAPVESTASPMVEPVFPTEGVIAMTPSLPTPADPELQNLIQLTTQDLATRLGVSPVEISLIEATAVEWSDSSLGCPQEGMSYLQVITPGYRIVFQINNQSYAYHTNRTGYFIYCQDSFPPDLPKQ